MGQEISQHNKSNTVRRQNIKETHNFKHPPYNTCSHLSGNPTSNKSNYAQHINHRKHTDISLQNSVYATSSISTTSSASTTDDEHYQLRQKYNLNKQTYEQSRVAKKYSLISNATTDSSTTNVTTASSGATSRKYSPSAAVAVGRHQRKHSQSTDSGIYYSSCHCASIISSASSSSVAASSNSLCSTRDCSCTSTFSKSRSSLDKQKHYLCRHLYIKSYLDILEEDEKARASFQAAPPGGIRNYKPKILAEASSPLSSSCPHSSAQSISHRNTRLREKCREDPWI